MRKSYLVCIISILVISLMLGGCGQKQTADTNSSAQKQQVYELNFQSDYMESHPTVVNVFKPWIEEVKKRSNGRLVINYYNPNALCPTEKTYDSVVAGIIDIGAVPMPFTPDKFPLGELLDLPFIVPNSEAGSLLIWKLFETTPEWRDQFKDVKVLWQWVSAPVQLHTVAKPVRTLEDIKGLRILSPTPSDVETAKILGASPIKVLPPDMYIALQRKSADGTFIPVAPVKSLKLDEVTKYHTMLNIRVTPFYAVMNVDTWNSLPDDLKNILIDTTGTKMAQACGVSLDEGAARDVERIKEQGNTFIEFNPEEKEKLIKAVEPLYEEKLKQLEAKGYSNARQIFENIKQLAEKYSK
ncbi:TRAP transporter substrate-binding protein [Moorella sulfitireducens (nom. illeg.)]|uniref:TRAP transporter substrate-binding protein n=1 Tax=Neomoorella sulfitireducens TaxID=2972948 RepID=UPI0021AC90BC|nr:TRAP transporter substrate-binding protein [Moorella sulfitireducens]